MVIKNSVFVGTVGRARDVQEAKDFIGEVGASYADANHNAWAYRIDDGPQGKLGFSDDGEPGGTAGRPMLAILQGSGLFQVVAVVTRYFGGTKLGTGGLVRAYGGAVREAIKSLATTHLALHRLASFPIDYGLYSHLKYLLPRYGTRILDESFGSQVVLQILAPYDQTENLCTLLEELTNGAIVLDQRWTEDRYVQRLAG
jgi:uncharacterized YigZ family protein